LQPTASATPEPRPQLAASTPGLRTATSPLAPYALRLRIRSCRGCCGVAGHHTSRRAHTGMRDVVVQGKADMYALRRTMRALVATRAYGRT
jgi:hypothetical protein